MNSDGRAPEPSIQTKHLGLSLRCREKGLQPAGRQPQGKIQPGSAAVQEKLLQGLVGLSEAWPLRPVEAQILLASAGVPAIRAGTS